MRVVINGARFQHISKIFIAASGLLSAIFVTANLLLTTERKEPIDFSLCQMVGWSAVRSAFHFVLAVERPIMT